MGPEVQILSSRPRKFKKSRIVNSYPAFLFSLPLPLALRENQMKTPHLQTILGQLFILGFRGAAVTRKSPIIENISKENLGGVILFDRHLATASQENNILNEKQLKELTTSLQSAVQTDDPLLIAVDQEGGKVNRFKQQRGFAETPAAAWLGAANNTEETRKAAAQTASLLQQLGINLNFAPVADLNSWPTNPVIGALGRSFSHTPTTVIEHCATWISEHTTRGILTCLKHFPGHGSSRQDSHHHFVDISHTWNREELIPYRQLIERHLADSVMIGHLFHHELDHDWPATLSKNIVQMLKTELRFSGPVLTDDMQMKAITSRYGLVEACCRSIAAGVDLVVIGNNIEYDEDVLKKVQEKMLEKIEQGELKETRVLDAWQRVHAFKNRLITERKTDGTGIS